MVNSHCTWPLLTLIFMGVLTSISHPATAQDKRVIRIAKLRIDSAQLDKYRAALREGIETAVRVEPGVLMLYAVYDKNDPANVTVFEIYADQEAYQSHVQSPHFLKYKTGTKDMVKSLDLIDVSPIALKEKASK